jgi:hypothetical protein
MLRSVMRDIQRQRVPIRRFPLCSLPLYRQSKNKVSGDVFEFLQHSDPWWPEIIDVPWKCFACFATHATDI